MKYCIRCLQPDTRPNTKFTVTGICPACDYYERLQQVDWQERYERMQDLIARYRRKPGQYFDCIIGVSGGKDSTRQALWVRDKLGLRPLLACLSYPPEQVTERGVDNISNLIELGFDVVISAPAPQTWRTLMRESFARYDGNNLRYMNTLAGGALDWMLDAGARPDELMPYVYPTPEEFESHGLQIVYLGWFLGDWSLVNNGMYSCASGLHIREDTVENTGDLLGITSLDEDWVTLNQMIKYYKFGFGRVTDYVNEEIRLGRCTRQQAIALVEQFDDACSDEYIESFCEYIGCSVDDFWAHVHKSVNRKLFDVDAAGRIERRFKVGAGL